jgi:hypothetical protein
MMSYSANTSLWQEFHEHKSGNEGKVYGGCKRDATVRRFKRGLQWWTRSTFRAKR